MTTYPQQNPNNERGRVYLLLIIILAILMMIGLNACVTPGQVRKICATCPSNNTVNITTKDSTAIKDSLAKIAAKDGGDINFSFGSEVSECDSIKAELTRLKEKPFIKHQNGVTSTVKSDGHKVTINCSCDSAEIALKKLKIEHWALINSTKEDKVIVQADETWWQTLYRYGFYIESFILLIICGIGAFKFIKWIGTRMP